MDDNTLLAIVVSILSAAAVLITGFIVEYKAKAKRLACDVVLASKNGFDAGYRTAKEEVLNEEQ